MSAACAAYRISDHVFVVDVGVANTPEWGFVATVWHLSDQHLETVVLDNGEPFEVSGPTAWQASLRIAGRLEGYMKDRAYELRDFDAQPYARTGTWRLPA